MTILSFFAFYFVKIKTRTIFKKLIIRYPPKDIMSIHSFKDLVTSLCSAVSEAHKFIDNQHFSMLNNYFSKDSTGKYHEAITVKVQIPSLDSASNQPNTIEVPLITLIPLSSIKIGDVTVEFEAHLSSLTESSGGEDTFKEMQFSLKGGGFFGQKNNNVKVKLSLKSDEPPEGLVRLNERLLKYIP
jgi:hypothetical protein